MLKVNNHIKKLKNTRLKLNKKKNKVYFLVMTNKMSLRIGYFDLN